MTERLPMMVALLALALSSAACSRQQVIETTGQTLYNTAQAACRHADNCTNRCADGTPWRPGPIRCP